MEASRNVGKLFESVGERLPKTAELSEIDTAALEEDSFPKILQSI